MPPVTSTAFLAVSPVAFHVATLFLVRATLQELSRLGHLRAADIARIHGHAEKMLSGADQPPDVAAEVRQILDALLPEAVIARSTMGAP